MKLILISALVVMGFSASSYSQKKVQSQNEINMKLNAGLITEKINETKQFYTENLYFEVIFENEFYLLMQTPGGHAQLSFLLPDHPSQQPLFQSRFQGNGVYITIEVDDVDEIYHRLKLKGVEIKIDLRDEPWGDRHFAIQDPNGVGIDIVKYTAPAQG